MTGEEKRRQLKEQYKRDLKLRKEFLEKAKSLRHQTRINKALGDMLEGMNDDSQTWIDQINQETALTEAKFDMFLDQAEEAEQKAEQLAKEAEMKRINAESLVEQMKKEMGLLPEEEKAAPSSDAKEKEKELTVINVEEEGEKTSEPSKPESSSEASATDEQVEPPSPKPPQRKSMGDF